MHTHVQNYHILVVLKTCRSPFDKPNITELSVTVKKDLRPELQIVACMYCILFTSCLFAKIETG